MGQLGEKGELIYQISFFCVNIEHFSNNLFSSEWNFYHDSNFAVHIVFFQLVFTQRTLNQFFKLIYKSFLFLF